ncbi:MAG TPA: hypothetical protein VN641_11580 [Urbifossiella sp.]|jgi:hypothetical protein|nr:hypothetical protein [Urbifossiella sp.]
MENVKVRMRELVDKLPEGCTWQQVMYRVYLSASIAKSEVEIAAGEGIPHEQVMQEMEEWLGLSGARLPASTWRRI